MLRKIAALLTRTSIRPNARSVSAAIRAASSSRETSTFKAIALPPVAAISLTTLSPSRTSVMTTAAPSLASLRQYAAPMCRAPPVTIATLPPSLIGASGYSGVMERGGIGILTHHFTPILHHSNSSLEPFQMFFEVERLPPRFDTERFGNDARGVVTWSAGDVTARMARRATEVKTLDGRFVFPPAREWPVLQRLITGILADHPVTAIHVAVMPFDIERRGRIR